MEKPKFVYRYCSAARAAQVLEDLTFFMAPASSLNDLFEFRGKSFYMEDEHSRYRVHAKRLVAEGWYSEVGEAYEAARLLSRADIDATYAAFKRQLDPMLARSRKHSGVTCFTAHHNNQRMWATYGANHSGACIEFTTSAETARFGQHILPILYVDRKISICISEFLTTDGRRNDPLLALMFCIKHVHWRDEDEWRMLLLSDSPQSKRDRLVPIDRAAITRVFLGPRMDSKLAKRIERAADSCAPGVPVYSREIDESHAREEVMGFERISSLDQLMYWAERWSPGVNTKAAPGSTRPERERRLISRIARMLGRSN